MWILLASGDEIRSGFPKESYLWNFLRKNGEEFAVCGDVDGFKGVEKLPQMRLGGAAMICAGVATIPSVKLIVVGKTWSDWESQQRDEALRLAQELSREIVFGRIAWEKAWEDLAGEDYHGESIPIEPQDYLSDDGFGCEAIPPSEKEDRVDSFMDSSHHDNEVDKKPIQQKRKTEKRRFLKKRK